MTGVLIGANGVIGVIGDDGRMTGVVTGDGKTTEGINGRDAEVLSCRWLKNPEPAE
jgi:hypothetical protein